MDVVDAIKTRRTSRRFKDEEIGSRLLDELLQAARLAPSGSNTQPLRLFAVTSKKTKQRLQKAGAFAQGFVYTSPLILVFCGNPKDYGAEHPTLAGKGEARCLRDVSIASSFVVLRATELGLSACWVGMLDEKAIKSVLGIDDELIIPFVICFGKPADKPGPISRKPIEEILLGRL
jgi:nitroreductase